MQPNATNLPQRNVVDSWVPLDLHGPRYISNLEGLVLDMDIDNDLASSKQFNGGRSQQWFLQFHPNQPARVALASLHNGKYLRYRLPNANNNPRLNDLIVSSDRAPFYWQLTRRGGVYSLTSPSPIGTGRRLGRRGKLSVPTTTGPCKVNPPSAIGASVKLLILENTDIVRTALSTGTIGTYAYPSAPAYYTSGTPNKIIIFNHLEGPIYAAMSGAKVTSDSFEIGAGKSASWSRVTDSDVHINLPGCIGSQSATVYPCYLGKILHIQSVMSEDEWGGLQSILPNDAAYTVNPPNARGHICIKNNLSFPIYAVVLNSTSANGVQSDHIQPGKTSSWPRTHSELVLVSIGSPTGTPRAYMARVNFTLQIYSHNH